MGVRSGILILALFLRKGGDKLKASSSIHPVDLCHPGQTGGSVEVHSGEMKIFLHRMWHLQNTKSTHGEVQCWDPGLPKGLNRNPFHHKQSASMHMCEVC